MRTHHAPCKYQKSSLVVSTYCLQEHNTSRYPFMKNNKERWKGKEMIWSRRWVFWCGSFWKKIFIWCWKLEKVIHPEFILSWQKLWFSVFRYCGKCFLAFFSDFISSPLFLFLKNKHTQNKNRAKRREKEILLLMLCGKTPSPGCSAVRTWLATCIGASPVPSNSPLFLQGRTSKC